MPRRTQTPVRTFNIFLIKEGSDDQVVALDTGPSGPYPVQLEGGGTGDLYLRLGVPRDPPWLPLLAAVARDLPTMHNMSNAALLVVRRAGRTFALTFGHGRHMLAPGSWEEGFGLKVTLNSVDPGKIRSLDSKSFDAISTHRRTQSSRPGSMGEFGLQIEQDLVRAVTGAPVDDRLGRRLHGKDSLAVSLNASLPDLLSRLDLYLEKFHSQAYKENFPWIDQVAEVKSPGLRDQLDDILLDKLRTGDLNRLWMAAPEIVDWSDTAFRYPDADRDDFVDDLDVQSFLDSLDDPHDLSLERLKRWAVRVVSMADGLVRDNWAIYKCLYCEIEHEAETYLLNEGKWYRVESGYVEQTDAAIARIPAASLSLPDYGEGSREFDYNRGIRESDPAAFALMDKELIHIGGGYSQIEFCDLFTTARQLIHVKRYGAASVMSHLFSQAVVSADLFVSEAEFRRKVLEKLPESHHLFAAEPRPNASEYEVILVIARASKDLSSPLPFFSRINLRRAVQRLDALGFRVSLLKIPIVPSLS